jgi:phosphoribosylamine-glycine ligase
MGRVNSEDARIINPTIHREKHTTGVFTATGNVTLTAESPDIIDFNCNGSARNLVLPANAADLGGRVFRIYNSSPTAVSITVQQSDAATTVITIAQGKAGEVWLSPNYLGTVLWRGLLGA